MTPRALISTIGATALTFGVVIGGCAIDPIGAAAREAQTAEANASVAEFEAARAEAYEAFVASLAGSLGSDEEAVDAAIREALTLQVAEQLDTGEITEEEAAAWTAAINGSDAPLGGRGFGGHGFAGHGPNGSGFGRSDGPRDGDRDASKRADGARDDGDASAQADATRPAGNEEQESIAETPEA